jgi:hypothetical protein
MPLAYASTSIISFHLVAERSLGQDKNEFLELPLRSRNGKPLVFIALSEVKCIFTSLVRSTIKRKLGKHDVDIKAIIQIIDQMIPEPKPVRKKIGFQL